MLKENVPLTADVQNCSKIWGIFIYLFVFNCLFNTLIQRGCIKSIKTDSKDIYSISLSNKCSSELTIHQMIMTKIYISTKILSSTTVFNIDDNMKYFLSNQSINQSISILK